MYGGFNKSDGSVVNNVAFHPTSDRDSDADDCEAQAELGDLYDSTAAEESMVCIDQEGEEITLTAHISAENGDLVWVMDDKDAVLKRTLSMSQMTSMLRDTDRNQCYEESIAKLVDNFRRIYNRAPVVLDIGAGTGLLSLLSIKYGAEFVFAAEMFDALATVAERVVADNGVEDRVLVIHAKSNDVDALPLSPDMIVSELIDSALLGEGCLPAHYDAVDRLLRTDWARSKGEGVGTNAGQLGLRDRLLPYSGTVYATLISSAEVQCMHDVTQIKLAVSEGDVKLHRPQDTRPCPGGRSLVPVHWSEMKQRGALELSVAKSVLSIPLHPADAAPDGPVDGDCCTMDQFYDTEVTVTESGIVHGILLHWTLFLLSPALDPQRQHSYSSAPGMQNWQDHWMPCVYALPAAIAVDAGDIVTVRASFDSVKVTVSISHIMKSDSSTRKRSSSGTCKSPLEQIPSDGNASHAVEVGSDCTCGWHLLCGGERFQMMCDPYRAGRWHLALDAMIAELRTILGPAEAVHPSPNPHLIIDASDGSLLSLATAAKLHHSSHSPSAGLDQLRIVSREKKLFSRMFFEQLIEANDAADHVLLWDGEDLCDVADFGADNNMDTSEDDHSPAQSSLMNGKVVAVFSECYYYQLRAFPRMQALSFYYYRASLHRQGLLHSRCITLPARGFVMAAAVELPHLHACHGPVDAVCGFDHSAFNSEVQDWHSHWFPYKLADYQMNLLCAPLTLCTLDFDNPRFELPPEGLQSKVAIDRVGRCHAVAVWMDYGLIGYIDLLMLAGDTTASRRGVFPNYSVANLKFFPAALAVDAAHTLTCRTKFLFGDDDFSFDFRLES